MKALIDREDLQAAKHWADNYVPKSVAVSLWLKINLDRPGGLGTSIKAIGYADRWPQPNIVAGVDYVEGGYGVENYPNFCFFANLRLDESEILEKFLFDLSEAIGLRRIGGLTPEMVNDEWTPACRKVFADQLGLNASVGQWPCKAYWMTEKDRDLLRHRKIEAPEGFEFGTLDAADSEFVDEMWPHRYIGSLKQVQRRIRDFPNICLRQNGIDNRLASFELVNDTLGIMNHLYTVADFRRKGLGQLVESKLAQIIMDLDYVPVKTVLRGNVGGEKITDACPWWTYFGDASWMRFGDQRLVSAYDDFDSGGTITKK